jgi:hypothetical protein
LWHEIAQKTHRIGVKAHMMIAFRTFSSQILYYIIYSFFNMVYLILGVDFGFLAPRIVIFTKPI